MKIIKPTSVLIGECPISFEESVQRIEQCGRICYDSKSKGDPITFVKTVTKNGHLSVIEHSNISINLEHNDYKLYNINSFKFLNYDNITKVLSGNWRAWYESGLYYLVFDKTHYDLFNIMNKYVETNTQFIHINSPLNNRYTAYIETSRGVMAELTRHRLSSFSIRSTRYCDESNMEICEPYWYDNDKTNTESTSNRTSIWVNELLNIENSYKLLKASGLPNQGARGILPNDLLTKIYMTADLNEWKHVFKLRCNSAAHPDIQIICNQLKNQFEDLNLI